MTIRHTLLISYLLVSLTSALIIALMISAHFKVVLQQEIENKLKLHAATIMQEIDSILFERMENVSIWSRLGVMQEIRVRDIDKRLSQVLHELKEGYGGVYQQLFVVNQHEEIIAASEANLIGSHQRQLPPWLSVSLAGHRVSLQAIPLDPNIMFFSTDIQDEFQGGQLGRLFAGFDWNEISNLLNAHLPLISKDASSLALLVDNSGRIIAFSSGLGSNAFKFRPLLTTWPIGEGATGTFSVRAEFLEDQPMLVGYARSQGYRTFSGFGWKVLILQSRKQAFAPIWRVWEVFTIYLGLTLLLGIAVSLWISAKIARPIVCLAEFTRDFMRGKQVLPPTLRSSDEIAELSASFSEMINNLQQSKQDLIRVAKLAVIGEMAATMAHEVRTPLGILRSSAQMLQREDQLSEEGREMTGFILSETQRLNVLVTTLLECARPKAPQFARHDLHQIIEHTLELLQGQADQKQIALHAYYKAKQPVILCDKDQLIQVFLNLVINAIQHVPAGGRIDLETVDKQRRFEITICDNGCGINASEREKIFDPFYTRRESGVGLGLTVVQQIVIAHQGEIFVTDSPFGGACFHVCLPTDNERMELK